MFITDTLIQCGSTSLNSYPLFSLQGRKSNALFSTWEDRPAKLCDGFGAEFKTFASQKSDKKVRNEGKTSKTRTLKSKKLVAKDYEELNKSPMGDDGSCNFSAESYSHNSVANSPIASPSRSAVLQACIATSGLLLALGALVRQASHIALTEGWVTIDSSTEVSFGFESWHIELIIGLVMLISSCRYILLKMWPDFLESSEAANQQVLSSLQPLDYVVVAFLPGISEELLFRGALLPLFGLDWKSALAVGAVFGVLHLGNGRRYSFAVWATFVGFSYGLATVISSSVIVPMASHSLNNLIGGILWRYTSDLPEKNK